MGPRLVMSRGTGVLRTAPEIVMTQAAFEFHATSRALQEPRNRGLPPDDQPAARTLSNAAPTVHDSVGFELGWDHARHGLAPAPELMRADCAVRQGWITGRAAGGRRAAAASRPVRRWLALRTAAWRDGQTCDPVALSPQALMRLEVTHCPVLRHALGGVPQDAHSARYERLDPDRGWVPGNVLLLSRAAAAALRSTAVAQAQRHAARLALDPGATAAEHPALDAAAWLRVAALRAQGLDAAALPWHEAARVAAAALPPPGTWPLHPLLQLQAAITLRFTQAGWAQQARTAAALLPPGALRTDWHLFVGALATRWLETGAPALPQARRTALEEAWLHPRVQCRWRQLSLQLDAQGCAALLPAVQAAR
jgi:hypothetical protein